MNKFISITRVHIAINLLSLEQWSMSIWVGTSKFSSRDRKRHIKSYARRRIPKWPLHSCYSYYSPRNGILVCLFFFYTFKKLWKTYWPIWVDEKIKIETSSITNSQVLTKWNQGLFCTCKRIHVSEVSTWRNLKLSWNIILNLEKYFIDKVCKEQVGKEIKIYTVLIHSCL